MHEIALLARVHCKPLPHEYREAAASVGQTFSSVYLLPTTLNSTLTCTAMSLVPSPLATPRTNVTSPTTQAPLPEVEAVQDILMTMKGALSALGVSYNLSYTKPMSIQIRVR